MASNKISELLKDLDSISMYATSDEYHPVDNFQITPDRRPTMPSPPAYRFPVAKPPQSPVWRTDYDHRSLIHSPSHLAFQPYTDANGNPIQVLPPYNRRDQYYTDPGRRQQLLPSETSRPSDRVRNLVRDPSFGVPDQQQFSNQQHYPQNNQSITGTEKKDRNKKTKQKRKDKRQQEQQRRQREKSQSLVSDDNHHYPLPQASGFNSAANEDVNAIEISATRNRLRNRLPEPEPAFDDQTSTHFFPPPSPAAEFDHPYSRQSQSLPYLPHPSSPAFVLPGLAFHQQHMPATNGAGPVTPTSPAVPNNPTSSISNRARRLPNHVQVADAYIFQQNIDARLESIGVTHAREDALRLAGVQWLDQVRRALKLPVRTFDTACIYYHKFRLVHGDNEYAYVDAAAAALFAACKIEDTLKKSREILCAAHNLKAPSRAEQLSPDDPAFDASARTILGHERLMLEASGFDFRSRHPQNLLIKMLKQAGHGPDTLGSKMSFKISLDLYRTMAPLKQGTAAMAAACLELAERICDKMNGSSTRKSEEEMEEAYHAWGVSRAMVMETLLDLLDIYTSYRTSTSLGPTVPLDTFLQIRIPLNEEGARRKLPRFTEYIEPRSTNNNSQSNDRTNATGSKPPSGPRNAHGHNMQNGTTNGGPATSRTSSKNTSPQDKDSSSPGTGGSGSTAATGIASATPGGVVRPRASVRGRDGTVRFMLNPEREREERGVIAEYGEAELQR
ncbi:CTD kinase subunit beta [Cyphellophora attinorum]|uniref:RNA polymerase II holoenzyme cyclin-like subunit n=1 Tax=Cyphellophora attinorum TaxID=1664694 RepID=A0A0N0NPW8_9EURO|nr:CTD kinase subunit beta [Phialophora attinorum]KPI43241.1 CTD kinase subunit beta [Phialophora attinorum]